MIVNFDESDVREIRDVTRICDECGKNDVVKAYVAYQRRRRLGGTTDLCKSCASLRKYKPLPRGKDSKRWKHGTSNGYLRRTLPSGKRQYEHVIVMESVMCRPIKDDEIVHHIDLNKTNNAESNLHLFENRREHNLSHYSLEQIGYGLMGDKVWFDWGSKEYAVNATVTPPRIATPAMLDLIVPRFNFARKQGTHIARQRVSDCGIFRKIGRLHVMLIEMEIGRRLYADECVHHINGVKDDNRLENLCLMTRKQHRHCHFTLQKCVAQLYVSGDVIFENGRYHLEKGLVTVAPNKT